MIKLPNEFAWVDQSDETFSYTLESLLETNKNLNIIGSAGSGKSLLIKIISQTMSGNTVICSTTGISAINLSTEDIKASTLHSFFQLGPLTYFPENKRIPSKSVAELIEKMDTLVIDESSMMSAHLFDVIFEMIMSVRGAVSNFPRIILFSDIFQLPPIINIQDESVKALFTQEYGSNVMFFNGNHFKDCDFETITLNRIYRQKNGDFQKILNRIRVGDQTSSDMNILNKKVISQKEFDNKMDSYMYLATTNKVVESINKTYINDCGGKEYVYDYQVVGKFDLQKITKDRLRIRLKEGMQVMCTANNYVQDYRNGTLGRVAECFPDYIRIETNEGRLIKVEISKASQYEYFVNANGSLDCKTVGTFSQLDCRVSKAISIHRSQGQTLDAIYYNPGNFAFATGLTYVALSRLTSIDGLGLSRPLKMSDIKVNKESLEFLENNN